MKKEKRISYKAGITRTPSDFLCQDGELAECINLTTDNEELKVMVEPRVVKSASYKLLFVHKLPDGLENEIYETELNGSLWLIFNEEAIAGSSHPLGSPIKQDDITAIGNTLIVNMNNTIAYMLYKNNRYKNIGKIEGPGTLEFAVTYSGYEKDSTTYNSEIFSGGVAVESEAYDNMVVGLYEKMVKRASENKFFVKPFMVRYALEMYDGSYTAISNPIICYAGIHRNALGTRQTWNDKSVFSLWVGLFNLRYNAKFDYSEYSDILKGVVVFVSEGVNLYDLTGHQFPTTKNSYLTNNTTYWLDCINSNAYYSIDIPDSTEQLLYINPLSERGSDNIKKDLTNIGVFYKLAELGLKQDTFGSFHIMSEMDNNVLPNLTSQERLPLDYYSNAQLSAKTILTYNNRLILANVKRSFFEGLKQFSAWGRSLVAVRYHIYFYIGTGVSDNIVHCEIYTREYIGHYLYYPDPRAYKAVVYKDSGNGTAKNLVGTFDMKEHPRLNGAYYHHGLPPYGESTLSSDNGVSTPPAQNSEPESLDGHLYQSEVNNPFNFTSNGDVSVGCGRIIGASPLTQALSQGQFGQYPLMVFTTEGLYAVGINSEGLLASVAPFSREIAIEANPCITQTDDSIFFVSKKGLMKIGRNCSVDCVSEAVNGRAFSTESIEELQRQSLEGFSDGRRWAMTVDDAEDGTSFLGFLLAGGSRIAYDYVDSRLLLFNPHKWYCWVYSLKDGSFSKMTLPQLVNNVVNNYPDYLLQDEKKTVYSLYSKKREEEDTTRKAAFLLTRPMKLAGPLTVTSLKELVNVGFWDEKAGSTVRTEVFVSDNLRDWYLKESRFGAAAKYYRLALFINMLPSERLSGTIVMEEERRNENARR